jgi:hypothetical protein
MKVKPKSLLRLGVRMYPLNATASLRKIKTVSISSKSKALKFANRDGQQIGRGTFPNNFITIKRMSVDFCLFEKLKTRNQKDDPVENTLQVTKKKITQDHG